MGEKWKGRSEKHGEREKEGEKEREREGEWEREREIPFQETTVWICLCPEAEAVNEFSTRWRGWGGR